MPRFDVNIDWRDRPEFKHQVSTTSKVVGRLKRQLTSWDDTRHDRQPPKNAL
jgi:hypothetical protein